MEYVFKKGDIVRIAKKELPSDPEIGKQFTLGIPHKYNSRPAWDVEGSSNYLTEDQLELVKASKITPPKFILQYELDKDPFELFITEKDVRARIKELAALPDLKPNSIVVYEIKTIRRVKLSTETKITFTK